MLLNEADTLIQPGQGGNKRVTGDGEGGRIQPAAHTIQLSEEREFITDALSNINQFCLHGTKQSQDNSEQR